jgi:hypothetical protein
VGARVSGARRVGVDAAMLAPRLVLVLLFLSFTGRASALLSCASEEELVSNLRWVREACEQEGEAFLAGDEDTLVPSAVTTAGCAEAVHRVAESCDGLLSRSEWFESRLSALTGAVESAAVAGLLEEPDVLRGRGAQGTFMIVDPDVTAVRVGSSRTTAARRQQRGSLIGRYGATRCRVRSCSWARPTNRYR